MKPFLGTLLFILVGLAAALLIGFFPSAQGETIGYDDEQEGIRKGIVIKFSHVVAENTPKGLAAQRFAELVQQKTGGRVKVEVYPNGVLYSEADEHEALMRGDVQVIAPTFSNISEWMPSWAVMDLPFAFLGHDAVEEAFNGEIGTTLFEQLPRKNVIGLAFWENGFKQMMSNRGPLIQPADFKGQRFRILPSKVIEAQFSRFDAKTVDIPFNQVYRTLEQGHVDGQENTISNINSKKFYQVQKYMTLSNHAYLGYAVLMNKTYWDKLPEELHQPILDAMKEATVYANETARQMNNKQLETMRAITGLQIHELGPGERKQWIETTDPIYQQFAPVIGEELVGLVRQLQRKYGQ